MFWRILSLVKKRGYQLQAEKRKSHTDNVISIVVAVLFVLRAALYLLNEMQEDVYIRGWRIGVYPFL